MPKGPLGQAVMSCQELSPLLEITGLCDVEGDLGIFTVLPELKMVHYQRTESWNMEHVGPDFEGNFINTEVECGEKLC